MNQSRIVRTRYCALKRTAKRKTSGEMNLSARSRRIGSSSVEPEDVRCGDKLSQCWVDAKSRVSLKIPPKGEGRGQTCANAWFRQLGANRLFSDSHPQISSLLLGFLYALIPLLWRFPQKQHVFQTRYSVSCPTALVRRLFLSQHPRHMLCLRNAFR